MTTNERMNKSRYGHFVANRGKSPFSKGPLRNIFEFFECTCFGCKASEHQDWLNSFDLDKGAILNVLKDTACLKKKSFRY